MERTPFERIAEGIAEHGFSVHAEFLAPDQVAALRREALALWRDGAFREAAVGAGAARLLHPEVRRDLLSWLDPAAATAAQAELLHAIEQLRLELNRRAMLGLFDFEAHFAVYPPGAFYRRHLDQFRGTNQRAVSCIVYLNEDWGPEDGGELRLHLREAEPLDVIPAGGTLVSFLSAELWHEVRPAARQRLSLTGWLRRRGGA